MTNELSRMVDRRSIGPEPVSIEATEAEKAALSRRFGLVSVDALSARIVLEPKGEDVDINGTLDAQIVQVCAISGENLAVSIHEPFALRFVPEREHEPDEEIELAEEELDEIEYSGTVFDMGEAVAQSLALAIDPYATGPDAEDIREKVALSNSEPSGPFAALAALKKD